MFKKIQGDFINNVKNIINKSDDKKTKPTSKKQEIVNILMVKNIQQIYDELQNSSLSINDMFEFKTIKKLCIINPDIQIFANKKVYSTINRRILIKKFSELYVKINVNKFLVKPTIKLSLTNAFIIDDELEENITNNELEENIYEIQLEEDIGNQGTYQLKSSDKFKLLHYFITSNSSLLKSTTKITDGNYLNLTIKMELLTDFIPVDKLYIVYETKHAQTTKLFEEKYAAWINKFKFDYHIVYGVLYFNRKIYENKYDESLFEYDPWEKIE